MRLLVTPSHHAPGDRATSTAGDTFEIAEYELLVDGEFAAAGLAQIRHSWALSALVISRAG